MDFNPSLEANELVLRGKYANLISDLIVTNVALYVVGNSMMNLLEKGGNDRDQRTPTSIKVSGHEEFEQSSQFEAFLCQELKLVTC